MSEWLRQFQKPSKAPASDATAHPQPEIVSFARQSIGPAHPPSFVGLSSTRSEHQLVDNSSSVPDHNAERPSNPDMGPIDDAQPSPAEMQDLWHQPTIQQMVDALYVIMMTKPTDAPLPVEYNSYVQRLLEGYAKLAQALRDLERLLDQEKQTKLRTMEEFTKMTKDWEQKEADYKAEIRRMEVVLANSVPEGVEAVVLARSGSIVDRSLAESRRFQARVSRARGEANADTEDGENNFDKTVNSDCKSIVESPNKSMQRSHKTILTMQRSVNHRADMDLSERLRSLQGGARERSSAKARRSKSTDYESTSSCQRQTETGLQLQVDQLRAKGTRLSAATSTTGVLADPIERTYTRCHRRNFSFDPGEDALSLPKPYQCTQTGSPMGVTCNVFDSQTATVPLRRATMARSDSGTNDAERTTGMRGERKAISSFQNGVASHGSICSKITAFRDASPNPTSDKLLDIHSNGNDASLPCHRTSCSRAALAMASADWSAEGADCMEMEQARLLDKSIGLLPQHEPLGEGQIAALAAQLVMARGPSSDGRALTKRTADTSHNEKHCP